jgi:hypothetical protein
VAALHVYIRSLLHLPLSVSPASEYDDEHRACGISFGFGFGFSVRFQNIVNNRWDIQWRTIACVQVAQLSQLVDPLLSQVLAFIALGADFGALTLYDRQLAKTSLL